MMACLMISGARISFPPKTISTTWIITGGVDLAVYNVGGHSANELHNYFTIEWKRGYGVRRNPLNYLARPEGFEPPTA